MRGLSLAIGAAFVSALVLGMASTAAAGHCHHACKKCVVCCCQQAPPARRSAEEDEEPRRTARAPVAAPIVQSMPVYAMPAMFATLPVMPAVATTRAAEPRGASDCCERVDKLEEEMKKLAKAVGDLQVIVQGQTEVLKVLAERKPGPSN
jgi:hypothetical protein